MNLVVENIAHQGLRDFLMLLAQNTLSQIVVVGGAARDCVAGRPLQDIDIAVRLPLPAPGVLKHADSGSGEELVPELWEALAPLARLLGCDVSAFWEPVPFAGTVIDVLGLTSVRDRVGRAYPDIFVDEEGALFVTRPDLTVNHLVLRANGLVSPDSHIRDLAERIARFTAAPRAVRLRQIARGLRTARALKLRLARDAQDIMLAGIARLRDAREYERQLHEVDTRLILRRVTDGEYAPDTADHRGMISYLEELIRRTPNRPCEQATPRRDDEDRAHETRKNT